MNSCAANKISWTSTPWYIQVVSLGVFEPCWEEVRKELIFIKSLKSHFEKLCCCVDVVMYEAL